jgi:2-hydroxychromene-2-carboxylate isomerase
VDVLPAGSDPMTAPERIHFYFDPVCPWAWVTSRWAVRLEELGDLEIEWRLFSLGVANLPKGEEPPAGPIGPSGPSLELLAQARRTGGNAAVGKLFTALGTAAHVRHQKLAEAGIFDQAWSEAGLDPANRPGSGGDPSLWQAVLQDHREAVARCQAFGVPTLILDDGEGPGIFGPVVTEVPSDTESRELLQDVLRLTRRGYFFELKRDRVGHPPKTEV